VTGSGGTPSSFSPVIPARAGPQLLLFVMVHAEARRRGENRKERSRLLFLSASPRDQTSAFCLSRKWRVAVESGHRAPRHPGLDPGSRFFERRPAEAGPRIKSGVTPFRGRSVLMAGGRPLRSSLRAERSNPSPARRGLDRHGATRLAMTKNDSWPSSPAIRHPSAGWDLCRQSTTARDASLRWHDGGGRPPRQRESHHSLPRHPGLEPGSRYFFFEA
jgi:hypothetical protein